MNPGVFAFNKHNPTLQYEQVSKMRPSAIKAFIHLTDDGWWREVMARAPGAYGVVVDGERSDNRDMSNPAGDAEAGARELDRCPSAPRRVMGKNELLLSTNGADHWQHWLDYHIAYTRRARQLGFNVAVGALNTGHPGVYLFGDQDQWSRLKPLDNELVDGDCWDLHSYWNETGPLGCWPWTAGRHMLCPTNHKILIGECGYDKAVLAPEGTPNHGWQGHLSRETYIAYLIEYHRLITDPRVVGTCAFLLDFDNPHWASWDITPLVDDLVARYGELQTPHERAVMPARLQFPLVTYVTEGGQPRITQTFAQHPSPAKGLDISCYTGSPVLAVAPGTVDKVIDLGTSSYGKYIQINHGWGFTLYAHLSRFDVTKGQAVIAGQVIGASGNTGTSTGPHLHFEVKSLANRVYPHRVDPAPLLVIGGVVAPSPQPPPNPPTEPSAFTEAELQRCREAKGIVPATIKAAVENGYVWLKEVYTPGDPYAFAVVWDNAAGEYAALKLETRTWEVVAERAL
jgi:hypothetical protein